MTYTFILQSEEATKEFAAELASYLLPGDILTLSGDLGAGKTTFTKGLAKGLGIQRAVTSPTFTIIKEYEGKIPLYHIDAYRLEHSDEDIGFDEYFYGNGIAVVEWATFIADFLPEERLEIDIAYKDETSRQLTLQAKGQHPKQILSDITRLKGNIE